MKHDRQYQRMIDWTIQRSLDQCELVYLSVDGSFSSSRSHVFFFFQAEDGIRDLTVTGVQTCALPIWMSTRTTVSAPPISPGSRKQKWRCRVLCARRSDSHGSSARRSSTRGWSSTPADRKSVV